MKNHNSYFCIDQMAKVLEVSRSGYYDFLHRTPSKRALYNEELISKIKSIFSESYETYGSPRIHVDLVEQGYNCSRPRVARLMRENKIQAKMYRKFKKTTRQSDRAYHRGQDLVQQNFSASKPNSIWIADISHIPVGNKWGYLAVILDLFSRKVVGMALEETMKAALVVKALNAAASQRKPSKGLIHHSDLGSQYTGREFYKSAKTYGIILSHGKTGVSYDNAAMESFFHTLKTELIYFRKYQSIEEARLDIFSYIYTFYNQKRRHSTLKYQTPNQLESNYKQLKFVSV
jgi:putative transposase